MRPLRTLDLCCGAGGWLAAARGLPIQFVAVADWAPDCLETVRLNHAAAHPDCQYVLADLSSADGRQAVLDACSGGIDLVVGAIPCEQLSSARANRPLKPGEIEGVHNLIDGVFDLVRQLQPRWWVFEDVIQVEGHLPPPIFSASSYRCLRIQAADYGPQKRLRTFFGSFPDPASPEPGPRTLADVLRPGPYRTLPQLSKYKRSKSKWYGQGGEKKCRVLAGDKPAGTVISSQGGCGTNSERSSMVRVIDLERPSPTILSQQGKGGVGNDCTHAVPIERPLFSRERPLDPAEAGRTVISSHGGTEMPIVVGAQARLLDAGEPSSTVTSAPRCDPVEVVDEKGLIRVLEWQEAAALQGFDPSYVFAASWSRTWKLVAQAIPIYVGRALLQGIVADAELQPKPKRKARKK